MRIARVVGLVVGGALVGAMVSATAQEGTQRLDPPVPTAVAPRVRPNQAPPERTRPDKPQRQRPPKRPGMHGPMRSEAVFPGRDGGPIRTVRIDNGVIESVDGPTVVVKEQDGTVVRIPTDERTRFARDGERATLQDLKAGDHVHAVRHKEGDGALRTVGVRAISAERYAQCEADPQSCRPEKRRPA